MDGGNQYSFSLYRAEKIILNAFLYATAFKLQNIPAQEVLSPFTGQIRKPRFREEETN